MNTSFFNEFRYKHASISTINYDQKLTMEMIKENPNKSCWDWALISLNPNLTFEIIRTNIIQPTIPKQVVTRY